MANINVVLDPTMMQKVGTFINGRRTANIFEDTIDEDCVKRFFEIQIV